MSRLALATAVVLLVVIAALAIWQMHLAIEMFLISLVLASGVSPMVAQLTDRGIPRSSAVALSYGLLLLFLVGAITLSGTLVSGEIAEAIEAVPRWYENARHTLEMAQDWRRELGGVLPSTATIATSLAGAELTTLSTFLVGITGTTLGWGVHLLTTVSLGFYWMLDRPRFQRLWFSLLPLQVRGPAREVLTQVVHEVGIYIRSVFITVALSVLCLVSIYSFLGIPGAMLLALVGGLVQVVPLLSLPIAIIPATLIAFAQGQTVGLITLIATFLVLTSIKRVVQTTILREAGINTNPVLVIFLIMVLAEVGQIFYILLAPALAAAIQVSMRVLVSEQRIEEQVGEYQEQLESLRARIEAVEQEIDPESPQAPQMRDLLARAYALVTRASEKVDEEETATGREEPVIALEAGSMP